MRRPIISVTPLKRFERSVVGVLGAVDGVVLTSFLRPGEGLGVRLPTRTTGRGDGHWMMIACCAPLVLIASALVATGVASAGFVLAAAMCTTMMAAVSHGGDRSSE